MIDACLDRHKVLLREKDVLSENLRRVGSRNAAQLLTLQQELAAAQKPLIKSQDLTLSALSIVFKSSTY